MLSPSQAAKPEKKERRAADRALGRVRYSFALRAHVYLMFRCLIGQETIINTPPTSRGRVKYIEIRACASAVCPPFLPPAKSQHTIFAIFFLPAPLPLSCLWASISQPADLSFSSSSSFHQQPFPFLLERALSLSLVITPRGGRKRK